eukprot:444828-Karenia_brevis.AAC.1
MEAGAAKDADGDRVLTPAIMFFSKRNCRRFAKSLDVRTSADAHVISLRRPPSSRTGVMINHVCPSVAVIVATPWPLPAKDMQ